MIFITFFKEHYSFTNSLGDWFFLFLIQIIVPTSMAMQVWKKIHSINISINWGIFPDPLALKIRFSFCDVILLWSTWRSLRHLVALWSFANDLRGASAMPTVSLFRCGDGSDLYRPCRNVHSNRTNSSSSICLTQDRWRFCVHSWQSPEPILLPHWKEVKPCRQTNYIKYTWHLRECASIKHGESR